MGPWKAVPVWGAQGLEGEGWNPAGGRASAGGWVSPDRYMCVMLWWLCSFYLEEWLHQPIGDGVITCLFTVVKHLARNPLFWGVCHVSPSNHFHTASHATLPFRMLQFTPGDILYKLTQKAACPFGQAKSAPLPTTTAQTSSKQTVRIMASKDSNDQHTVWKNKTL